MSGDLSLGDLLVGVGTLLLASFTWSLARQTKNEVRLTTRSVEAMDMPYVIATPVPEDKPPRPPAIRIRRAGEHEWLEVRLWNLGKGPAIITDVRLSLVGQETLAAPEKEYPIHAGGAVDADLALVADSPERSPVTPGELRIYYRHASGNEYVTHSRIEAEGNDLRCLNYERSRTDHDARGIPPPEGSRASVEAVGGIDSPDEP